MRGAFTKEGINNFLDGIMIGKFALEALPTDIKFATVSKWDGKDAETYVDEDIDLSDVTLGDL